MVQRMVGSDRRAVALVVVALLANAALDLSGYENGALAVALWAVVVFGVAVMIWPTLPKRMVDRFRGERGWTAAPPGHLPGIPDVVFRLFPPEGHPVDTTVTCELEFPDGQKYAREVRPPGSSKVNGEFNRDYHAVFTAVDPAGRAVPWGHGWHRFVWYSTKDSVGRKLLRVRWFKIKEDGSIT